MGDLGSRGFLALVEEAEVALALAVVAKVGLERQRLLPALSVATSTMPAAACT